MIRFEQVGLRCDQAGAEVLRDISFSVPEGGFCWLLGPSGAGKSSLLRVLHLAQRPTRGRAIVLGVDIGDAERGMLARLRRRIGAVLQDFRLLAHLSTFDNVALPLRLAGRPEGQIRADVLEILSWVGLVHKVAARPPALSGGEQQRVAIARAVVVRPNLLLADELTGHLDEDQTERMMALLKEMNRLGTTVIIGSHDERLARQHPARSLRLAHGRLVSDQRPRPAGLVAVSAADPDIVPEEAGQLAADGPAE